MGKFFKNLKDISYYGFPVGIESKKETLNQSKSRGIALLIALMTIMLMVGLVADMIVTSSVNLEMAIASRDRVRAEYLAKSGFNFAVFILSMSWGYDLFRAQPDTAPILKQDLRDDDTSMWNMVKKLPPIGALTMELLKTVKKPEDNDGEDDDPFKLRGVMNDKVADVMKMFEDSFTIKIIDEASKINVNACFTGRCQETIQMLTALFHCPAEKAFIESKNIQEDQLVYRIKDFIWDSSTTSPESGLSDKNAPYTSANPPYSTKGVPYDTVDELKLVSEWDDQLHAVFSPYLTVYPYPTTVKSQFSTPININTVSPELLSCLIADARSHNCAENFAQKMFTLKKEKNVVAKDKASIKDVLKDIACLGSDPSLNKTSEGTIDPVTWFDVKSSVFRIEIDANTGNQNRKLVAVVRRIMPQEKTNQRDQQAVKHSYQILHWNLM